MPLPHNTVAKFYEGSDPSLYTAGTGSNLNEAINQLLTNDAYLMALVTGTKMLPDPSSGSEGDVLVVNGAVTGFALESPTSLNVPSVAIERDAAGRFRASPPVALSHAATKGFVDSLVSSGSALLTGVQDSSTSLPGSGVHQLTLLDENRIGVLDSTQNEFQAYDLAAGDWTVDPISLALPNDSNSDVTALSPTSIAVSLLQAPSELRRYDLGSSLGLWAQEGASLSLGSGGQAAMAPIALTGNDTVAFVDSGGNELRTYELAGGSWSQVGNGLALGSHGHPALSYLAPNTVAFIDAAIEELRTYSWNGTNWSQVGNSLSIPSTGAPALSPLPNTQVAFVDTSIKELRTYDWNGTNWTQVGNGLALGTIGAPALANISSTQVAFIDASNAELRTYSWDGTDWSQVGNSLAITNVGIYLSLSYIGSGRVAFIDVSNAELRTYEWDGTDWSLLSGVLPLGPLDRPVVSNLSSNRVSFFEADTDELRAYEYTPPAGASGWNQVGNTFTFPGGVDVNGVSALDASKVALVSGTERALRTYEFSGSDWALLGNSFSLPSDVSLPIVEALTSTRVAVLETSALSVLHGSLYVYEFDGSNWSQVGLQHPITAHDSHFDLAKVSPTIIAVSYNISASDSVVRLYKFDGTTWGLVSTVNFPEETDLVIGPLTNDSITVYSPTGEVLASYRFQVSGGLPFGVIGGF